MEDCGILDVMVIKLIKNASLIGAFLSWPAAGLLAAEENEFVSASSWEEIQQRQRSLPTEDIWWTVTGTQMAWMHKNVHQLFPTVNVYRSGQVSDLQFRSNSEIATFQVETASGELPFAEFLASDATTTLGLLILHQGKVVFESYPRMEPHENQSTGQSPK